MESQMGTPIVSPPPTIVKQSLWCLPALPCLRWSISRWRRVRCVCGRFPESGGAPGVWPCGTAPPSVRSRTGRCTSPRATQHPGLHKVSASGYGFIWCWCQTCNYLVFKSFTTAKRTAADQTTTRLFLSAHGCTQLFTTSHRGSRLLTVAHNWLRAAHKCLWLLDGYDCSDFFTVEDWALV